MDIDPVANPGLLPLQATTPTTDSLKRYESLQAGLDLIDQGFTLIDENLCMVAWNQTFLRLLDFPQAMGYVGASFESFIRFNAERGEYGDGDLTQQVNERVKAARVFSAHDIERIRPNGTVLRVRGVPVPNHGFVTLYSDVTEQRRSERLIREHNLMLESRVAERTASLRRSEQQMRLITDSIPALVAYVGSDHRYHYINRGYQDWFGLDPAHPQSVSARDFLGTDTYQRIRPHVMQANRGEAVTFEYDLRTVDGRNLVARTSLIPEVAADGSVAGCFELTFDITDQRRSHELMARAQKMDALGQLTGGLAHDFNNILTVILGSLTALAEEPTARSHVPEYIGPAIEAARRGSELIKGLLSFSRKHPVETSVVDVNQVVAAVDKLVRRSLPETTMLKFHLDGQPLNARLDSNQLQNALVNLILNARDATEGRGDISIRCHAETLNAQRAGLLHLPSGAYACVQVNDNGCGMDAATRARVFEPFFTTKSPGTGTGLGMAMVYGFARQSGGTVDIISEPDKGTTVTLWLPSEIGASSRKPDQGENARRASTQPDQGLALLVEDDANVRRVVRRLLLDLGFAVLEAENGQEALQILDQTSGIRLLLSDIVMPGGVDGRQVARHAVQQGQVPKIILMSGYAPDSDDLPGIPLLAKPFTKAQLADLLQGVSF
jgi:signal transduction histidine kinase/CheY-like chemotaxis protein